MWRVRASAVACILLCAACSGTEGYGSLPPGAPSPSGTAAAGPSGVGPSGVGPSGVGPSESGSVRSGSGPGSVEAAVLAQYTLFWTRTLPAAAAAPAAQRSAVLAPVTTEPQLSHLVRSLAALDANGQTNYGADVPVRQTVRVDDALALVEGCLDSSRSGVADAATGAPVTRGVTRNPVRANLTRGADGRWRVSAVTYPRGTTC